jgi:hypothetical protein
MVTEQPEATDMTAEPLGRTAMLTDTHEGMQEMKDVIKLVEAIRQLAGPDPVQVDITLRVAKVIGYHTASRAIMEAVEGTSYIEQLRQGT